MPASGNIELLTAMKDGDREAMGVSSIASLHMYMRCVCAMRPRLRMPGTFSMILS